MKTLHQESITGTVVIVDASGATLAHVALYQPSLMKKFAAIIQVVIRSPFA